MELMDKKMRYHVILKQTQQLTADTQKQVMKSKTRHSEAHDMAAWEMMENGDFQHVAQHYIVAQIRQQTRKYSHLIMS